MNFRFKPPVQGVFASFGSLFGQKAAKETQGGKHEEDNLLIDVDEEGNQLYKEDIIQNIHQELERRRTEKAPLEQQWILNANFLVGNQYCDFNTYRGEIEQLEPVYDWLERETFNQIAPLIETRIANLKKLSYGMKVKPRTNELDDYAKAEVSTSILKYMQSASNFNAKKDTAISWNELCGSCFWLSWWDKGKGEKIAKITAIEPGENGAEKKIERAVYEGDIDYGLITPYEIFPESIFKQGIDAQRSVILEQVKTVDDVFDLYGVKVKSQSVESFQLTPIPSGGGFGYENTIMSIGHRTVENAVKVITYFEIPSAKRPDGLMVILIGDEEIVYYGGLPYGRIPISQMTCRDVPGQFFGKSVIEDLIPRQRAYNGCLNRIHEYIKRVAIQSYLTEEGSIDIEEFEENGAAPGAMMVYRKGANPPVPIPNGNLPSEIMQERYNLKSDMEYVAGTSQLMVNGATPSGVTSGTAIENLMEIDNTRISLTGDHIRDSVKDLAVMWLEIFRRFATTRRVVRFTGTNDFGKVLVWCGEDINSFDVEFTTENELSMSEDVQKQRFFDAFNMGMFTDSDGRIPERVKIRALEYMKMGQYSELLSINTLQMQAAQRENAFFENGVFPEVSEFDNHDVHLEEHMRYILQMDFQVLKMRKKEYAMAMEEHIRQHKQEAMKNQQQGLENLTQLMQKSV